MLSSFCTVWVFKQLKICWRTRIYLPDISIRLNHHEAIEQYKKEELSGSSYFPDFILVHQSRILLLDIFFTCLHGSQGAAQQVIQLKIKQCCALGDNIP